MGKRLDPYKIGVAFDLTTGEPTQFADYDEPEVTRRIAVLKRACEDDPEYEDVLAEIREFHATRRALAYWVHK